MRGQRSETLLRTAWLGPVGAGALALVAATAVASPRGPNEPRSEPLQSGHAVHLPLVARNSAPPHAGPLPTPVPGELSNVLDRVPVPLGARLEFFEARQDPGDGEARAEYAVPGLAVADLERWSTERLPAYGWVRSGQRWIGSAGHWLELDAEPVPDGVRIVFTADTASAAASTTGIDGWTLPPGTRRRYDPTDIGAEEIHVELSPANAVASVSRMLVAEGWRNDGARAYGTARAARFVRGSESVFTAAWSDPLGSELSIGASGCLPAETLAEVRSVYVADVPGPPGASLVDFERRDGAGIGLESWSAGCIDLDLLAAIARARAEAEGLASLPSQRGRGVAEQVWIRPGGELVRFRASPDEGALVSIVLSTDLPRLRVPAGASLLSADTPLPAGARALAMTTDTPGWRHREVYDALGDDPKVTSAWLHANLPFAGWTFERTEPPDTGPALVFHSGGVTILLEPGPGNLAVTRRRVCEDGVGRIPTGQPTEAHWLMEVPVVADAIYDGWDPPVESYRLTCADLGLLADWYRAQMEQRNWALAGTELRGALARSLLFVRPDELGLPHEQRTAWATVELVRPWPDQYQAFLSRDPTGIKTPR